MRMMIWWRYLVMAVLPLCCMSGYGQEKLVNLLSSPTVKYTYLDENGNDLGAKVGNDKSGRALVDGKIDNAGVITSKYSANEKKMVVVLFEFPFAISPRVVEWVWMWGHNDKQWLDRVEVAIGEDRKQLKTIKEFTNTRIRQNVVTIKLPLPECHGRFVRLKFIQEADLKHFMFGIGEVRIMGTAADLAKLGSWKNGLTVSVRRHAPCNLFESGKPVTLTVDAMAATSGSGEMDVSLVNYFGDIVEQRREKVKLNRGKNELTLDFKSLEPGYYELSCNIRQQTAGNAVCEASGRASLGIAPFVRRSAGDALAKGCRFGIQLGFNSLEGGDAFALLGLQWVRGLAQYGPLVKRDAADPFERTTRYLKQWSEERPFNHVFEVKTFPSDCYDEKRYGPIAGRKDWFINTVPAKDKYQDYIRKFVERIPPEQKVFEIWNEPWDGMKPEEFAEIAVMTREAIKAVRPDAIVGPNLGPVAHLVKVIKAGGLNGMDMLTVHPYAADFRSSPERADLRAMIRVYHDTLKKYLGHDLPLYVTEIGWPTPPKGPMANSEQEQAQYMVRACLGLYAEGVKAVMPYCMGQPEKDPNDKEHFFGFLRKNQEPKPVLLAYANMARMIEGAEYLGDPWLGTDVGAMLFRKNGRNLLILYTSGKEKKIFLRPGVEQLNMVDIMGRRTQIAIRHDRLSLTLTGDPVYLDGVGDGFRQLIPSSARVCWSDVYKRPGNTAKSFKVPPVIDGDFSEWQGREEIKVVDGNVSSKDASATVKVGYDENNLYLAIRVFDDEPGMNKHDAGHVWGGDCLEIFFSPLPEAAVPGFLKEHDYQILVTPYSKSGKPVVVFGDVYRAGQAIKGCRQSFRTFPDGWSVELALPLTAFAGAQGRKGQRWAMEIALDDLDKKHPRIQVNSNQRNDNWTNSSVWSWLVLE